MLSPMLLSGVSVKRIEDASDALYKYIIIIFYYCYFSSLFLKCCVLPLVTTASVIKVASLVLHRVHRHGTLLETQQRNIMGYDSL